MMKWISVRDELPELFKQVIVLSFIGEVTTASIQQRNITQADLSIVTVDEWEKKTKGAITYWTPLPEPPEGTE